MPRSAEAVERGLGIIQKNYSNTLKKGRLTEAAMAKQIRETARRQARAQAEIAHTLESYHMRQDQRSSPYANGAIG